MLKITILLLGLFWCLRLWIEGRDAAKSRATLRHVVHVNGTRGKSTVCRLIGAGLRAGRLAGILQNYRYGSDDNRCFRQ